MKQQRLRVLPTLGLGLLLAACAQTSTAPSTSSAPFTLQLLHFADVDGGGTQALESAEAFSALVSAARQSDTERTLLLSSGDNFIPGPLYLASQDAAMTAVVGNPGPARGEIAFLNAMGVQASSVGNHDLDGGPSVLAGLIGADGDWPGSQFAWLAANWDTAAEPSLHQQRCTGDTFAPPQVGCLTESMVFNVAGRRVGVLGAVTPALPALSSLGALRVEPDDRRDLDGLAAALQRRVDVLVDDGINIIIVLAHMQQIAIEQALAERLEHVDVIVAGGSNTLLANPGDALLPGDEAQGPYPIWQQSPLGEPVAVVNVDGDYRYLGRAMLAFDAQGRLLPDDTSGGPLAASDEVVAQWQAQPIPEVRVIVAAFSAILQEKAGLVLGYSEVFLDGRRSRVRTSETNLGRVTAEANLWLAQQQDPRVLASIKNGGGIRAPIGEVQVPPGADGDDDPILAPPPADAFRPQGGVSRLDIETALAFNGELVTLSLTAAELKDVLEHSLSRVGPSASPGEFPQIAGLRVDYDAQAPARRAAADQASDHNMGLESNGERVRLLALPLPAGGWNTVFADGQWVADPQQRVRLVTLDFLAQCVPGATPWPNGQRPNCGDGYPFAGLSAPDLQALEAVAVPDISVDFTASNTEQYALAAYLQRFHGSPEKALRMAPQPEPETLRLRNMR